MREKIKHNKREYKGITFKSDLEVDAYKLLEAAGLTPEYEKTSFTLVEGFYPTVPFYKYDGRSGFSLQKSFVQPIRYTPDFVIEKPGDLLVVIEMKGFPNDRYPLVRKLFRILLETLTYKRIFFFEIRSLRHLKKAIKIIEDEES